MSAFAVLPAAAAAAPELRLDETILAGTALNDGILGPGEEVDVTPVWTIGVVPFAGGNGTIAAAQGSNVGTANGYLRPLPSRPAGDTLYPADPFKVTLGSAFVCGTNAPVTATVAGADGTGTYALKIPTGVAGPHGNYVSDDVGDPVEDASSVSSQVDVTATGKVKSVRVHLNSITHKYSLKWYEITLVSPSGTRVKVWGRTGDNDQKTLTDVTFADGAPPVSGVNGQFSGQTLSPDEKLSAFNGEDAKGSAPWTLEVRDVHDNAAARSNRVSRAGNARAGNGEVVGQVDAWSVDIATAECGRQPVPQVAPQPLILNPAPTAQLPATVIDGSESVDPGKNNAGNAPGAIVKYEWKAPSTASTWTDTGNVPRFTYPGGTQGKIKVALRVTDNDGQAVTKEFDALVTRPPVVTGAAATPSSPEAGQLTTLNATANDPDGTIAQFAWDFNGDGVFEVTNSDGPTTTYSWATSGPHVVRVKVTDNVGATAVKSFIVTVANKPPVAKVKANVSPAVLGQPVEFDASESTDPDGTIVSYDWDLDGQVGFEVAGVGAKYTKTFDETGTRTINVKATDNSGQSAVATMQIVVAAPPKAIIKASSNTPKPADTVTFDGRSSTDSEIGGAIAKYEWDLDGNNTYETVGAVVTRAYPNVANVQVKLKVTGSTGAKGDAFTTVAVANPVVVTPPPVVTPVPTATPKPGSGGGGGGGVTVPNGEVPIPGKGVVIDVPGLPSGGPVTQQGNSSVAEVLIPGSGTPDTIGVLPTGFSAKLTVAAKQKGKKAVKGIALKVTANGPSVVVVKGYFDAKTAKKLKLKPKKNAPLAVASGRLVIKKAGTYKFIVKVPKKYQRSVKKANKSKLMLRAAATETESKKTLAIGKDIILVK